MALKDDLLSLLKQKNGEYLSGSDAGGILSVSRAAIWKAIQSLKEEGYQIESRTNKGYYLQGEPDLLNAQQIKSKLTAKKLGRELRILPIATSTNTLLKEAAEQGAKEGTVLFALEQQSGRGRLGRSFLSPKGGLYFSVLLRPSAPITEIPFITMIAALSVSNAVNKVSDVSPQIKWVNDLQIEGKKLSGILTEASVVAESGRMDYVVVGIGMNLDICAPLPQDLRAISLRSVSQREFCVSDLAAEILNELEQNLDRCFERGEKAKLLQEYRARLSMLGKPITVHEGDHQYDAVALDLEENGGLIVRANDGTTQVLRSGEISIRPKG